MANHDVSLEEKTQRYPNVGEMDGPENSWNGGLSLMDCHGDIANACGSNVTEARSSLTVRAPFRPLLGPGDRSPVRRL